MDFFVSRTLYRELWIYPTFFVNNVLDESLKLTKRELSSSLCPGSSIIQGISNDYVRSELTE